MNHKELHQVSPFKRTSLFFRQRTVCGLLFKNTLLTLINAHFFRSAKADCKKVIHQSASPPLYKWTGVDGHKSPLVGKYS